MRTRSPAAGLHRARGFGLLEALVALVLLAGTGLALFSWLQQNLRDASRVAQVEREARLQLNALSAMAAINPMLEPEGEVALEGVTVSWRAEPAEPVRTNAAFGSAVSGAWRVGLYRAQVRAVDSRADTRIEFEHFLLGTQRLIPLEQVLAP